MGDVVKVSSSGQLSRYPNSEVSTAEVSTSTTTTSTTDELMASMTLTPGQGAYIVQFNASFDVDSNGATVFASLYVAGAQKAHTERRLTRGNQTIIAPVSISALVTGVGASDAIEVRWRVSAGQGTAYARTLIAQKL